MKEIETTTIPCSEQTKKKLYKMKGMHETWNETLKRLLNLQSQMLIKGTNDRRKKENDTRRISTKQCRKERRVN